MFKKRILIVDLDPGVLDTLFHVLNDEGYRVHTLLDVVNLESQVSLLSPDLIFLLEFDSTILENLHRAISKADFLYFS